MRGGPKAKKGRQENEVGGSSLDVLLPAYSELKREFRTPAGIKLSTSTPPERSHKRKKIQQSTIQSPVVSWIILHGNRRFPSHRKLLFSSSLTATFDFTDFYWRDPSGHAKMEKRTNRAK